MRRPFSNNEEKEVFGSTTLLENTFDRKRISANLNLNHNPNSTLTLKGVLNPNFRPFGFELRKN